MVEHELCDNLRFLMPPSQNATDPRPQLLFEECTFAYMYWWPSPAATACWQVLFSILHEKQDRLANSVQKNQCKILLHMCKRDTTLAPIVQSLTRCTAPAICVSRAVYLLGISGEAPAIAGVRRYSQNIDQSSKVRTYPASLGRNSTCLGPEISAPSEHAGIVRQEITASMKAIRMVAGVVADHTPILAPANLTLETRHLHLIAWAACLANWPSRGRGLESSPGTRLVDTWRIDIGRNAKDRTQRTDALREVVGWMKENCEHGHFHLVEDSVPRPNWRRLVSPLRLVCTKSSEALANDSAREFFQYMWRNLASQGDTMSSLLDAIFQVFDPASVRKQCAAEPPLHDEAPDARSPCADFAEMTALCYSISPRMPPQPASSGGAASWPGRRLVVGATCSAAELRKTVADLCRTNEYAELDAASWSLPLLVALEIVNHGFISSEMTYPQRTSHVFVVSLRAADAAGVDVQHALRHGVTAPQRRERVTHASSAALFWYVADEADQRSEEAEVRARNCADVWRAASPGEARHLARHPDRAPLNVAMALYTVAAGFPSMVAAGEPPHNEQRASSERSLVPPERQWHRGVEGSAWRIVTIELLLMATAMPGALLILLNCLLALPEPTFGRIFSGLRRRVFATEILRDAFTNHSWLVAAVARALAARGVLADVTTGDCTALELWLHSQRALVSLAWGLPEDRLVALLGNCEPITHAHALVYEPTQDGGGVIPSGEISNASFDWPAQFGEKVYVREDPWARHLGEARASERHISSDRLTQNTSA